MRNLVTSVGVLAILALPLAAQDFDAAASQARAAVAQRAQATARALAGQDYDVSFSPTPGSLYEVSLRVENVRAPKAEFDLQQFQASNEDTGEHFLECNGSLLFPQIAVLKVTLTNVLKGESQTMSQPVGLSIKRFDWRGGRDGCPATDWSGPLAKTLNNSDEVEVQIPELQFQGMEIVLLPFVSGLATPRQLENLSLSRSGNTYTLRGFDFEALRRQAVDASGAAKYQIGWRIDPNKNVEYVPLTSTDDETAQDPYGLNADPHECDEY